ncbi:MAG: phenylalanine--tRNA ligase subunit beta [Nitrososphaeria archaeon]
MPVLSFKYERLNNFLEKKLSKEEILEIIPLLGLNIEDFNDEEIKVEYSPNRPDYGSPAGIAKAINHFYFNKEPSIEVQINKSEYVVHVDRRVEEIRPYVVGLYARLQFSEQTLKELISLQEDLHEGIGRKRKKFAIGLHDASRIRPPIYYTVEGPEFKFVPLYHDTQKSILEILSQTEQGKLYGHLLAKKNVFPILKDSLNQVLSFPPIINGNVTILSEKTKELFVDITACELEPAEDALSILATALLDYGAKIYSVEINFYDKKLETPNLSPRKMLLNKDSIRKILGISLKTNEVISIFKKVNMSARAVKNGKEIEVIVPRHRIDILHEVDLIEEVGYGFGYNKLRPLPLKLHQNGKPLRNKKIFEDIRNCLIGLGFIEVMTFYLANKEEQNMFAKHLIEVAEPKTKEYNVLRSAIIPQLLKVLSSNIHEPYPQKVFEIGRIFELKRRNIIKEKVKVAGLISHADTSFTEIKSVVNALLNYLGTKNYTFKACTHPYFIDGRCAILIQNNRKVGLLGEILPYYIQKEGLRHPVSGFEISLEK